MTGTGRRPALIAPNIRGNGGNATGSPGEVAPWGDPDRRDGSSARALSNRRTETEMGTEHFLQENYSDPDYVNYQGPSAMSEGQTWFQAATW